LGELNIGWTFLFLIGGITIFVFFGQGFMKILKILWYGLMQVAIGALFLFIFNMLGQLIHLHMPINLITATIVGLLGLPGLATLAIIKWVFIPL